MTWDSLAWYRLFKHEQLQVTMVTLSPPVPNNFWVPMVTLSHPCWITLSYNSHSNSCSHDYCHVLRDYINPQSLIGTCIVSPTHLCYPPNPSLSSNIVFPLCIYSHPSHSPVTPDPFDALHISISPSHTWFPLVYKGLPNSWCLDILNI